MIPSTTSKYCGEVAAENSHQTIRKTQTIKAFPVILINIEVIELN
jgi:hypothetical protein